MFKGRMFQGHMIKGHRETVHPLAADKSTNNLMASFHVQMQLCGHAA